ncbi:hypothetical protein RJT34_02931 [Clitoria ternatea]|uniref:Uncharacterized protein n=1 Tax=Clitoria ternatea TaxID=43366 RepID=A0AAN9KL95_CLITE
MIVHWSCFLGSPFFFSLYLQDLLQYAPFPFSPYHFLLAINSLFNEMSFLASIVISISSSEMFGAESLVDYYSQSFDITYVQS